MSSVTFEGLTANIENIASTVTQFMDHFANKVAGKVGIFFAANHFFASYVFLHKYVRRT